MTEREKQIVALFKEREPELIEKAKGLKNLQGSFVNFPVMLVPGIIDCATWDIKARKFTRLECRFAKKGKGVMMPMDNNNTIHCDNDEIEIRIINL